MAKGMHPFKKRLVIFGGVSLAAAALLGLYAPSPALFGAGIVVLGLGMVFGILNYLMRPLPQEMKPMFDVPHVPEGCPIENPSVPSLTHTEPSAPNVVKLSVIRNQDPD